MKTFLKIALSIILLANLSCTSTKSLSSSEIKLMTTKQFDSNYEDVFKSTMSLLQSEQFSIEQSDLASGLIVGTKNIYKKKQASLTKSSIIVDKLNEKLTEVKITVYAGQEKITSDLYSDRKRKIESMIEDPEYYNRWFNNLKAEIEKRKALR